jgi:hypothetical protein
MKEKNVTSLVFHAEKLYDDRIWRKVEKIALRMARMKEGGTFFVYPFRSYLAGKDISERVQCLAALGHEIGQHTHFYAGTQVDKPRKVDDLSPRNMSRCIRRDFEMLHHMNIPLKGFTSGAWVVDKVIWDTVIDLGFIYDCSTRFPKPGGITNSSHHRWLQAQQNYAGAKGSLLLIPTTCSLGEWFKWGHNMQNEIHMKVGAFYQVIYLHDYDLLSFPHDLLLRVFLSLRGRRGLVTTRSLADNLIERNNING